MSFALRGNDLFNPKYPLVHDGGKVKEREAKALLTNFGLKIFHTVGDGETAKFASELLGHRRESFTTMQQKPDTTIGQEIFGDVAMTGSFNETYQPILQSAFFLSGMRNGGPGNGFQVDGILIRNGMPFNCGENWQFVTFNQK
jgi:hypothetical protein